MPLRRDALALALLIAGLASADAARAQLAVANDFPTAARADYVFACMASNGQTEATLQRCACSIDHVATIIAYEDYVNAETVMRTLQVSGERVAGFRGSARHQEMVANLRRAQAEADMVCF